MGGGSQLKCVATAVAAANAAAYLPCDDNSLEPESSRLLYAGWLTLARPCLLEAQQLVACNVRNVCLTGRSQLPSGQPAKPSPLPAVCLSQGGLPDYAAGR